MTGPIFFFSFFFLFAFRICFVLHFHPTPSLSVLTSMFRCTHCFKYFKSLPKRNAHFRNVHRKKLSFTQCLSSISHPDSSFIDDLAFHIQSHLHLGRMRLRVFRFPCRWSEAKAFLSSLLPDTWNFTPSTGKIQATLHSLQSLDDALKSKYPRWRIRTHPNGLRVELTTADLIRSEPSPLKFALRPCSVSGTTSFEFSCKFLAQRL